jgi:hypothetical protein
MTIALEPSANRPFELREYPVQSHIKKYHLKRERKVRNLVKNTKTGDGSLVEGKKEGSNFFL